MANSQVDIRDLPALCTKKQVAVWAGCSQRNIELQVKLKTFPAPIRLGSLPRWRRSDLLDWLERQSAQIADSK